MVVRVSKLDKDGWVSIDCSMGFEWIALTGWVVLPSIMRL